MGMIKNTNKSTEPYFGQDQEILKNANGKIVEGKQLVLRSKYSVNVECYKIKY